MTQAYRSRRKHGDNAEQEFKLWAHRQAGWHVENYGIGLVTPETRKIMRDSHFNGDPELIERLLVEFTPDERSIYFSRVQFVPNLTRWIPDFALMYRNKIVCTPDVKTSISDTPNWAVEMSSVLGSKIHSMTGIQCIYAFPPNQFVDYWSCATPDMLREAAKKVLNGKGTWGGSGTPFYLVSKLAINLPLRQVMTEIELNGGYEMKSKYGAVYL